MPENYSSVTESLKAGNRVVAFGIAAIVLILLGLYVLARGFMRGNRGGNNET